MPYRRTSVRIIATCLLLAAAGCTDDSSPRAEPPTPDPSAAQPKATGLLGRTSTATATDTSPMSAPPADNTTVEVLGLSGTKPATWIWKPPTRTMRKANFTVPGPEGNEAAELVITHFPEAPGNTLEANVSRWSKQFRTIDGGTPKATLDSFEADGMNISIVELHGEYMGMGGHWHKANYAMLAAVVDAPAGTVFIKMLGPDGTVDTHRDGYTRFIKSLRRTQ